MSVFQEVKKHLDGRFDALAKRCRRKEAILVGPRGDSVTWGSFRYMRLVYAAYPPEFATKELFFDRLILSFARHDITVPILGLLDLEPCVRTQDTLDAIMLQSLKSMYGTFQKAFLNSAQPAADVVPLRLKLQWTRRLAVEFPWEGRVLGLMARQAGVQELLDVQGARFLPVATKRADIAKRLKDEADHETAKRTLDALLSGEPGEWWFESALPPRAAEELRRLWSARYHFASLRNTVASWAAPGAFVLAVFLEAYLDQLRRGGARGNRFGQHMRIALEAHRKHPRAELLFNLGQAAHRLHMDRTAWYLLLRSARSLPAGSPKHVLQYHYPPSLLSALAELARKAGAVELARQYDTWFEERVLAEGLAAPELPMLLSSLGIASD
jgi:hypothetical protein